MTTTDDVLTPPGPMQTPEPEPAAPDQTTAPEGTPEREVDLKPLIGRRLQDSFLGSSYAAMMQAYRPQMLEMLHKFYTLRIEAHKLGVLTFEAEIVAVCKALSAEILPPLATTDSWEDALIKWARMSLQYSGSKSMDEQAQLLANIDAFVSGSPNLNSVLEALVDTRPSLDAHEATA